MWSQICVMPPGTCLPVAPRCVLRPPGQERKACPLYYRRCWEQRGRVAPGAQARGAAGSGQTSLCVAAGSERVLATSGQSVPFRPRVLHHPALWPIPEHRPQWQKENVLSRLSFPAAPSVLPPGFTLCLDSCDKEIHPVLSYVRPWVQVQAWRSLSEHSSPPLGSHGC